MRRTGTRLLAAALLATCFVPAFAVDASASWWEGIEEPKEVALEKIVKNPEAYLGVPVRITIQFHRINKVYSPFFTQFVPEHYVNFSAWAGGAAVWDKEQYVNSHPLLFVEKETKMAGRVLAFASFTQLEVTGVVRSTFTGKAWIEVTKIHDEGGTVSRRALSDLVTGDRYAAEGRHNAAIQVYQRAWANKDLPTAARAALAYRLGRSYFEIDDMEQAQHYLNQAVQLDPENDAAKKLLEDVVAHLAGSPFAEPVDDESFLDDGRETPVEDLDDEDE